MENDIPEVNPTSENANIRMSILDDAFTVLSMSSVELNTVEIVKKTIEIGLWTTHGKTPAATLYAALSRDIAAKGDESRFRKVGRGKFTNISAITDHNK